MPSRSSRPKGHQQQLLAEPAPKAARLTLEASSSSSRHRLANTADIPSFTHPSSQPDSRPFKPLPQAQKEPIEKKTRKKDKTDTSASKSGFARKLSKKQFEKAEAERKKREDPLEEAETGEYDAHGIWVSAPKEALDHEEENDDPPSQDNQGPAEQANNVEQPQKDRLQDPDAESSHQPRQTYTADTPWNDPERAIAQAMSSLNRMPSDQTFDDLLAADPVRRARVGMERIAERDEHAPAHLDQGRTSRGAELPSAAGGPPSGAIPAYLIRSAPAGRQAHSSSIPRNELDDQPNDDERADDMQETEWIGTHRDVPEIPMPPPAQRDRSVSPLVRQPSEWRLRYLQSNGDDFVGAAPDFEYDHAGRVSPTELNSSTILDPLPRPTTRRSNSHRQPYAIFPPPSDEGYIRTPARTSLGGSRDRTSSFAVSDTDAPTQWSERVDPSPPPPPPPVLHSDSHVKTYSKHKSRSSRLRRLDRVSHADRAELAFSPEPEWESQQRKLRQEQERESSRSRNRSKRHGSTSYWPDSQHTERPPADPNQDEPLFMSHNDEEDEYDDDGEDERLVERQPLGEVKVNQQGRVIARGRGRNGAWPEDRQLGLFDDGEESQEHGVYRAEYYRPVSERFHIAHRETDNSHEERTRQAAYDERIKAFPDRRLAHPVARLKMKRSSTVHEGLDGYSSRPHFRYEHRDRARGPEQQEEEEEYKPSIGNSAHTFPRPKRKRRDQSSLLHLPGSVLRPIKTITLQEYKKQQKGRSAGDGFLNPILVKSGRLAQRDAALRPVKRARKTGGGNATAWVDYDQTPIMGDDGQLDPIMPPTQTQREASQLAGFGARHAKQKKRIVKRFVEPRPNLPFTSVSPRPEDEDQDEEDLPQSTARTGLAFTTRQPRTMAVHTSVTHSNIDHDVNDPEDADEKPVHPAPQVLQLAQPRVGFRNRIKNRERLREADGDEIALGTPGAEAEDDIVDEQEQPGAAQPAQGFARKVPGFWAPPLSQEDAWALVGGQDQLRPPHPPSPPPTTSAPEAGPSMGKTSMTQQVPQGLQRREDQAPLFLPHSEESPAVTGTGTGSGPTQRPLKGMSGAQLCDDLLLRNSLLNLPIIPSAKTARSAKRDEMANRVANKGSASAHGQKETQAPYQQEKREGEALFLELDDEIEQPDDGPAYEPTSSQVRRRARFGMQGHEGLTTQSDIHVTQAKSLPGMSLETRARQTGQSATNMTSATSSDNHPPGNQEALHRPVSRTRWAINKGFVPPAPIPKANTILGTAPANANALKRPSQTPRWVTANDIDG